MVNTRPHSYWRLNETSGEHAASTMLENAGTDRGRYSGVTLGKAGPLSGSTATAAQFNGSSSHVSLPAALVNDATTQAISMWFKAEGEGVLYGQSWDPLSSDTTGAPHNPTLYVGSNGNLSGSFPKAPKAGAAIGSLLAAQQNQCIDAPYDPAPKNATVALADCSLRPGEQWTLTTGRELRTHTDSLPHCLDTEDGGFATGIRVVVSACNNSLSQKWDVQADGQIVHDYSGKCIDSETDAKNSALEIWPCGKTLRRDQSFISPQHNEPMDSGVKVVNDGKWHHVVLTSSGNSQQLYIDGGLKKQETGVTVQDMRPAYSYVGAGFLGGGRQSDLPLRVRSGAGRSHHLTGSIAEVALFETPLTAQAAKDLFNANAAVKRLTRVSRPSGDVTAAIAYDGVTGRVSQMTDGNGTVWKPTAPQITGTTKVHESAVLGGAPANYWRLADAGGKTQAVNEVNGNLATYSAVNLGEEDGPFGKAPEGAAGFNGSNSLIDLPDDVFPADNNSVSMWFNTTENDGVLLGEHRYQAGRPMTPTLWISGGELSALSPSTTPTGPFRSTDFANDCLDVKGGGTENGTPVLLWACHGGAQQTWSVVPAANGTSTVRALGKCLDVGASTPTEETPVHVWYCHGGASQQWQPYNGGLRNPSSGLCLTRQMIVLPQDGGVRAAVRDCNFFLRRGFGWKQALSTTKAVNDGKWHHVALTTSGTTQTLYLDGAKVHSSTGSADLNAPTPQPGYALGMGRVDSTWNPSGLRTSSWYKGRLAEVAFYGAELDASQVRSQYQARDAARATAFGEVTYAVAGPPNPKTQIPDTTKVVNDLLYGRKVADIDARGMATRYGYSSKGHLRTLTDPNKNMTINEHDVRGNVVSVTTCQDRSENKCSTTYNKYFPDDTSQNPAPDARNDRLIEQRGAGSASASDNRYRTVYTYDARGNRTAMTDPLGRTTTISYTDIETRPFEGGTGKVPLGLPSRITKPDGGVQSISYYATGDIAEVADPAGMVTRYEYDPLGRTTKETAVVANVPTATTTFTHDRLDRVVTVTDPAVLNHVSGATHSPVTTLTYTPDGLLASETVADATGGDAPRTVTYEHDDHGRRTAEIDELDNKVQFEYDAYGRVNRQIHADGSAVRTVFDAAGNELEVYAEPKNPDPGLKPIRSMAYDDGGRLNSVTDEMGWVTEYDYTDNNLLATVTRHDTKKEVSFTVEQNTYDEAGNLILQVTNNGKTTTKRTYDAVGRNTSATLDPFVAGGEEELDRTTTYGYSANDEVVTTTLTRGSTVLGTSETMYDRLGRPLAQTAYTSAGLSPVLRWKLDKTSGTTVTDSAGNTPGTVTGAVTRSTERGGAAVFGGTPATIGTDRPVVDTSRPYTLATWVKLGAKDTDRFIAELPGDINLSALRLQYDSGTDAWQASTAVRDTTGAASWAVSLTTPRGSATAGVWTHLAVGVDPNARTVKLYVGGVEAASTTSTKALNNRATGLRLAPKLGTEEFIGSIDDVQAYQKALSVAELSQIVAGTAPVAQARAIRTSYTLSQDGSVTSATDPNGNTTSIVNDEVGRAVQTHAPAVSTVVGAGNPVTARAVSRVGYNTFGEVTHQLDPNDNKTVLRYDGVGRVVETQLPDYTPPGATAPIKAKTTVEYNAVGQIETSIDPLGAVTKYEYDLFGRTTKVTAPDAGVTTYEYSADGELIKHTDPNGAVAASTHDFLGRTLTTTQAVRQTGSVHTTEYRYDSTSPWPASVRSAEGVTTSFTYNKAGEQTAVTDANNKTSRTEYDGTGRPIRTTAPDGTYSTVAYDLTGRVLSSADHSATGTRLRVSSQEYDAVGNTVSSTDARTTKKTFTYDALNQLISQTEPISGSDAITTTFGYDKVGQQTRFTDGRGNSFITTYNPWGMVASQVEPATASAPGIADRTFTMSYDAGGRMVRLDSPGGVSVTSEYDVMGRLKKSSGSGAEAVTTDRSFRYDKAGRIEAFSGSAGENTVAYDDRGLVTSISGVSGSSSYEYNGDGALTKRVDGAGTTAYTYDGVGRLSTLINTTAGVNLSYGYNDLSQVNRITHGGGNFRKFSFDDLHRPTSDELTTPAGASLGKIAYEWDATDNLTKKTTTGLNGASTNTYTYDLANRLVGWDNGINPVLYAYDKSGNRVQAGTRTFTYNERNQLTSDSSGTTYRYTSRGTLASATTNSVRTDTVTDAFNQVVTQSTKAGGTTSYTYDGLGRAIQTGFAYTGMGNDLATDGTTSYVRDTANSLVGVASGTNQRYAWTDIHTDVVGEFTATGSTLTGSVSYDPWGKVLASGGMVGRLGYQQEWTEEGTGKVNMWSRWYDPETGAFDTRDTATLSPTPSSGAANRFAYAEASPLTNTDTTGNSVDGKCGEYDYACELKKYQAALGQYTAAMEQRDRDMKATGAEIARQEAEYQRAERESQTSLESILLQVGVGMLLDIIGYGAIVGCLNGGLMACGELALSILGPVKAFKIGKSVLNAIDRAFSGYRMWKRIIEGAQTAMRQAQNLISQARKHLADVMKKKPKKPKPPKKKTKPPVKKKPKAKAKAKADPDNKPKPSEQAKKPKPKTEPKSQERPKETRPAQTRTQRERSEPRERSTEERPEPTVKGCLTENAPTHSFDPSTRVLMADGTTRPISEVGLGDEVMAKDPITGEQGARAVTLLHSNRDLDLTDVTVSNQPADSAKRSVGEGKGDRSTRGPTEALLETTAHHPFWDVTTGTWVNAAELVPSESTLVSPDGQIQYVTEVRNFTGPKVMRDLTVADIHTYYVLAGEQPVLVHNNNIPCVTGPVTKDTHFAQVSVRDADGALLDRYPIRSGGTTPEEAALGVGRARQAVHTEHRASRAAGGAPMVGQQVIKNDPFWGTSPVPEGGTVSIAGIKAPCGTCKGQMKASAEDTGARFEYHWPDGQGGMKEWSTDD